MTMNSRWQFWIDRGGTFTDIVAQNPIGKIIVHKLLSENPEQYQDAPIQGIRDILGLEHDQPIPIAAIEMIKMGTTVATNALLERKGDRLVLATTKGFKDALRIGYQNRPDIFALEIILPEMLYEQVVEINERYDAQGNELVPVDLDQAQQDLQGAYDSGIRSCAIVLMHSYRYPNHELAVAKIARQIGFSQVSISHQVSPLIKFVSRGDTTVVDAYLSPILRRYIKQFTQGLMQSSNQNVINNPENDATKLMFMQSNGGLVGADLFRGKDSILSGPAGGIVGAVKTCVQAGYDQIIGFDMGGTSTDVSHYQGEYERSLETEVAGVRLRSPMLAIHTVAAGGSSLLHFDGDRYRVGPDSAGANPGAAAYGRGGNLTVTDCNVMVGKLQPEFFPRIFGLNADEALDLNAVRTKFQTLADKINSNHTLEQIASGFLAIAVDNMANAIKKISLQKGYDVTDYTLCCFGGAGGQHACLLADVLGIKRIFIHPLAGVLSAYGIGLADIRIMKEKSIEALLQPELMPILTKAVSTLSIQAEAELSQQLASSEISKQIMAQNVEILVQLQLKYSGTDSTLTVDFTDLDVMRSQFAHKYQQRYGFTNAQQDLVVATMILELICPTSVIQADTIPVNTAARKSNGLLQVTTFVAMYTSKSWHNTPVYRREDLLAGDIVDSPAIITETTGTNIIEPGWRGRISDRHNLILSRKA